MVVKCEAIFNRNGIFYSGQIISGRICLSLDERILIKYLALKISGYAQTHWDSNTKKSVKPNMVNGREDYIATTSYLVGSEDSKAIIIPPGCYTYSFSCAIPEKSPSSIETSSGYIRYQVQAIIEHTNRIEEILTETLQVIKAYDLRPQALVLNLPIDMEIFESKCFCEYWKRPIFLYANIPQAGYVPGETISVYVRLINDGKVPLRHLAISLNQVVTFMSRIPRELTKTERYNVVQIISGIRGKIPLQEFLERIPIPNLPPTCDTDCNILQVSYEVEAIVDQAKGNRGVVVRIPVLMGTTSLAIDQPDQNPCELSEKTNLGSLEQATAPSLITSSSLESKDTMSSSVVSTNAPDLALKISGYAQTHWDSNTKKSVKPNMVNGREDYIATTSYLVGSEDSKAIIIPPGCYTYSFSCAIPEKSPSSIETSSGYIRYQVQAIIEHTNRIEEILTETLQVIKAYDLRPQALVLNLPIDMEIFESKCFCEYWKRPIFLYANIPQAGYVPGETISVYVRLINDGKVPLRHLAISLNQVVTFMSRIPRELTKTERYNVVQIISGIRGKIPLQEFLERIPIPNLPPTCDTDCNILQVSYEVEAIVDQAKGSRGVVVRIPVLMGTTSLAIDQPDQNPCELSEKTNLGSLEQATAPSLITSSSLESKDTMSSSVVSTNAPAASSFQEAAFMSTANLNKEDKHSLNKDKSGFKPKYLYYEINEDIEMTPTTMEITKEITIASK